MIESGMKYDDIRLMMDAENLNNWKVTDMRKNTLGIIQDTSIDLDESLRLLDDRIATLQTGYDKVYIWANGRQTGKVQNWAGARKWKALINEDIQSGSQMGNMNMGSPMGLINAGWMHPDMMKMSMDLQKQMHDFQMDVMQNKLENSDKTEIDKYVPQRWQDILFCKAVGMDTNDFAAIAKLSGPGSATGAPRSTVTGQMAVVAAGETKANAEGKPKTTAPPVQATLTDIEQTYTEEVLKQIDSELSEIGKKIAADKFLYLLRAINKSPQLAETAINFLTHQK